mgnify:CR=1 FL=1
MKNHPKGLMVLFFTEMWERFSYYGMRALLVLYLTANYTSGGFELARADALEIYAVFTGLVYLTPLIGGFFADRYLGQRKAIYIGAFLMALGQFSIAYSEFGDLIGRQEWLNLGLGLLIMGSGFFKPNISTIVGKLYTENDPRKDSAFTIFYMGINFGALLAPLIAGTIGEKVDWYLGFGVAGVGMILSTLWFHFQGPAMGYAGFPPNRTFKEGEKPRLNNRDRFDILGYVVVVSILVWGFLKTWSLISTTVQTNALYIIAIAGILALAYVIGSNTKTKDEWSRVGVILILCFFNVFFWSGFEQAGGTFNLFAKNNTDRAIGLSNIDWFFILLVVAGIIYSIYKRIKNHSDFKWWIIGTLSIAILYGISRIVVFTTNPYIIPASIFQSVNPILIVALAPLFSSLWLGLSRIGKNPNTPVKFGLGLILLGFGFVVMSMAASQAEGSAMVSPMWLLMVYLLHTSGELCLSPIGLSMVTKL